MPFPTVARPGVKTPQKATTEICTYFGAPHGGHTIQPNILYDTTPFSVQQNGSAKRIALEHYLHPTDEQYNDALEKEKDVPESGKSAG